MEASNLKHVLNMKQQTRYNGRVGLYPTNRIEQFKLNWSSSWGPTPNRWYSAEDKNFRTDFGSGKKDLVSYVPSNYFTYSTTKNSLPVISIDSGSTGADFYTDATNTDIGYNTTRFVVVKPWAYWQDGINSLNFIEQTSYSTVGTPATYGASTIYIPKTGYIFGASVYSTNNNSTQNCTIVGGTYSAGEWSIVVHKGKSSLAQTSSGTINGRVMGATTSIPSTIIPTGGNGIGVSLFKNGGVDGAIAEVIIYNSILSAGDTTLVENYLKNKWAISY